MVNLVVAFQVRLLKVLFAFLNAKTMSYWIAEETNSYSKEHAELAYMDSYGICQQLTLKLITCPDGQFFDSNLGCQACSATCKTCRSANACITCHASGFVANSQGICTPNCGDGLFLETETCDSGSSYTSRCINCQIETEYTDSGQPSV
jgi:hypothetical protein